MRYLIIYLMSIIIIIGLIFGHIGVKSISSIENKKADLLESIYEW